MPTPKRRTGGSDEDPQPPSTALGSPREPTLDLIRSLRRSTRNLEKALKDASGSRESAVLAPEKASGVRRRLQTVLVVANDDDARTILVSRLLALGFFVESVADLRTARDKARRSAPDVLIAEHPADGSLTSYVDRLSGSERPDRPFAVLRLEGSLGGPTPGRAVTVVQWRESARQMCELVAEVMRTIKGRL